MGVRVDKSWRNDESSGVDHARCGNFCTRGVSDKNDALTSNSYIDGMRLAARSINNGSVSKQNIYSQRLGSILGSGLSAIVGDEQQENRYGQD
jgi:hypothetical protein